MQRVSIRSLWRNLTRKKFAELVCWHSPGKIEAIGESVSTITGKSRISETEEMVPPPVKSGAGIKTSSSSSRDAAKIRLDIMKEEHSGEIGDSLLLLWKEMAAEYLKMGFYLGIGGVLTSRKKLLEVAEMAPRPSGAPETDCPTSLGPNRGKRQLLETCHMAEKAGRNQRNVPEEIVRATEENEAVPVTVKSVPDGKGFSEWILETRRTQSK